MLPDLALQKHFGLIVPQCLQLSSPAQALAPRLQYMCSEASVVIHEGHKEIALLQ